MLFLEDISSLGKTFSPEFRVVAGRTLSSLQNLQKGSSDFIHQIVALTWGFSNPVSVKIHECHGGLQLHNKIVERLFDTFDILVWPLPKAFL